MSPVDPDRPFVAGAGIGRPRSKADNQVPSPLLRNAPPWVIEPNRFPTCRLIPIPTPSCRSGYSLGRFEPVCRIPLSDVVFQDGWGQAHQTLCRRRKAGRPTIAVVRKAEKSDFGLKLTGNPGVWRTRLTGRTDHPH